MSNLNLIRLKKGHTPLQVEEKTGEQLKKDMEHLTGKFRSADEASATSKPGRIAETASKMGWEKPASISTPQVTGGATGAKVSHGGQVLTSASPPPIKQVVPKVGSTVSMQSLAKPGSEKEVKSLEKDFEGGRDEIERFEKQSSKPLKMFSDPGRKTFKKREDKKREESIARVRNELEEKSMSGPPKGTMLAASANAYKVLEKAAEEMEKKIKYNPSKIKYSYPSHVVQGKEVFPQPGVAKQYERIKSELKGKKEEKGKPFVSPDSLKSLEKAAEKQEKHYGKREGTKDPKGSMSRIKKYKTKGGKIKSPPKDEKGKDDMAGEMIAHHMHHLGRHPGGEKQAIAIGLNQAGMSRKDKSMKTGQDKEVWSADKVEKAIDELVDLSKAMTARMMPSIPRPMKIQYEKDIFRSAMDIPTNYDSKLAKDIPSLSAGYLKPDVLAQVRRDEEERTHREMNKGNEYDNCDTCGRMFYKSLGGCPTCTISKAAMCKACGHQMVKGKDGQLRCSICG